MGRRPQLNCIRADLQIAFVLPVGLAIGKYVHNLLQSGLRFAQTVLLGQALGGGTSFSAPRPSPRPRVPPSLGVLKSRGLGF